VAAEGRWIATEAPIDRIGRRAMYEKSIQRSDAEFFVADEGGNLLGILGMEVQGYGVAEFGMMVDAAARGRGVGGALLSAAVEWAREHGAHKVALQVWPDNAAAIALYEKHGFEKEGVLRRHYVRRNGQKWDAVVMGLLLDG